LQYKSLVLVNLQ